MVISAGSPIELVAEAVGNPLPFLRWYFNGKPIESTPECALEQLGPMLENADSVQEQLVSMAGRLVINELFPTDEGVYRCVAENPAGQAVTEISLRILSPGASRR